MMGDGNEGWGEIKREIIESRNQAIKTDNQVKNLSLDVKAFEKRFDLLEKRTRLASISAHVIVAVVLAAAAFAVVSLRSSWYQKELAKTKSRSDGVIADAQAQQKDNVEKLAQHRSSAERHAAAQATMQKILDQLAANRGDQAAKLLADLHINDLSPLEKRLVEGKLRDLRRVAAETAYKKARTLLSGQNHEQALQEFKRSLELDASGRYSDAARYLTGTTLHRLKRYADAEPVLRDLRNRGGERALQEDIRYYLGTALAQLGKQDEAKGLLKGLINTGRYQRVAKAYVAALEAGGPLPGSGAETP